MSIQNSASQDISQLKETDTSLVFCVQMVVGRMKQEHHFAIHVITIKKREEKELSVVENVVRIPIFINHK